MDFRPRHGGVYGQVCTGGVKGQRWLDRCGRAGVKKQAWIGRYGWGSSELVSVMEEASLIKNIGITL